MSDPIIGKRLFVDGITRDVFRSPDGRQYVMDWDNEKLFGYWILEDDEPDGCVVVERT